jgi:hypothetical protein
MKYITWILAGAVAILAFSQWRSCRDKTAEHLTAEKKEMQHQQDSIIKINRSVLLSDSLLRLNKKQDSIRFSITIDSLKSQYQVAVTRYKGIRYQLISTVSDLSESVNAGTDSGMMAELLMLKDQLSSADNVVQYLQANTSQQDSIIQIELNYRDSVIQQKDSTIDLLRSNNAGLLVLLDRANADLDVAIKQLQKGKRMNVLRTIGEAILLFGLILKK